MKNIEDVKVFQDYYLREPCYRSLTWSGYTVYKTTFSECNLLSQRHLTGQSDGHEMATRSV